MRQAIYKWLLNFFHVHAWVDESQGAITNKNNKQVGTLYVQRCSTCGKRRHQNIDIWN